ncbi:E3 ubiquitin-protein ligase RNF13-like [Frankliniella occidentalis]|uniref:E3 ubiquitin-protein ligase RNF13-like n=1 Tax=Frankliniella occidentalis TaxID=133901 RepID=A0A6J1S5U1_FRAOC|nr:E3 ubiquitin-protein ligase RNF13-like [Frankliniella occidentalis]
MPSPPLMLLCAAGVGLAALLYYYFAARELEGAHGAAPRGRQRSRNGSRYELEECSICQEVVFKPSSQRILACGHNFHIRCIEKWQEASPYPTTCPNCRQRV